LKKPTGSVRFYKPETEKTKPNQNPKKLEKNRAKSKKIEPNLFEPVFVLKNRTELKAVGLNRF
jgi:hypothetical protein